MQRVSTGKEKVMCTEVTLRSDLFQSIELMDMSSTYNYLGILLIIQMETS